MQKEQFCLCYILTAITAGRCRERRYADHIIIYSDILQNAPFCSQIFKIFFALDGKGALTPLTKIMRTFLSVVHMSDKHTPHLFYFFKSHMFNFFNLIHILKKVAC